MPPSDAAGHALVAGHTVHSCVVGSRAFGLAVEGSDTDRRGVYLPPTELFWRFEKPPSHVTGPRDEEFSWELERFCALGLRSDPNVLECLHSPLVERIDATGRELLALRGAFLSRQLHRTFTGFAASQFTKVQADVRREGAPRWKHAMHLLRVLVCCRDTLRSGVLATDAGQARAQLLAVRRGELSWDEVTRRMTTLTEEAKAAVSGSPLPAEPDRARVEDFLVRARRAALPGAR
ncbi:DNA polymerase beta superfamily protein [Streptomyces sp. NPDC048644]|uniref:nucleotidyltransferase domain-containing protein n=1 Tax=Streptomyces sp. NPDC048644 TaxID=3365582 RepID=UPI00372015D5